MTFRPSSNFLWTYRVEDMKDLGLDDRDEFLCIVIQNGRHWTRLRSLDEARKVCAELNGSAA